MEAAPLKRTGITRFSTGWLQRKIGTLLLCFFACIITKTDAQVQRVADSLAFVYRQETLSDDEKLELLRNLAFNEVNDLKKALSYAEELIRLSSQSGNDLYLRRGYYLKGTKERLLGNLDSALHAYFKSAEIAKKLNNPVGESDAYGAVADIYSVADNHLTAMQYYNKAITTLRKADDSTSRISLASILSNAGDEYRKAANHDSALLYLKEAHKIFQQYSHQSGIAYSLGNTGMVYASLGQNDKAENYINEAVGILEKTQDHYPICDYLTSMADVYRSKGDTERALNYALKSRSLAEKYGLKEQMSIASLKLSELNASAGNDKQALKFYKDHIAYRDSINNIETDRKLADLRYNFDMSQKQEQVNLLKQQKISLVIILVLSVIVLGFLFRNNRSKQRAYQILDLQKKKTDELKAKAEDALTELQVTQKQLIQTAKMASLGELTAGIAHEIQNPLNFVNNFSEVSIELLDELNESLTKATDPVRAEAEKNIHALAENLKKISDHGKRADSIVKGMLQHSRISTGKKEPTDINTLTDEYLRLSYHGLRAKDKTFNASFTTNFDGQIGRISIIPQEIGRVLLNLFNNAFYAVNEKKRRIDGDFAPLVTITTRKIKDRAELRVKDNGTGISQDVLDKIFQPFFTTKPAGQGTGLGLSLSYDIIKAHGGDMHVETKEGEYTEFILHLPMDANQNNKELNAV